MAQYIVKALKTYLKSPLTASATSLVVRKFVDSKGNELSLSDFGSWFVVVVKQGDTIEMIKCDGITQSGTDTSATLDVATNGRNLDPTTPYAGSSSGNAFQSGAEVIVTNDPLTVMQFGNLNNAQTWSLLQTFTLAPVSSADAVSSNELVRKSQLDSAVLGSLTNAPVVVPANAGETLAVDQVVYLKSADGEWYLADADTANNVENVVLGITRGAGTDGNAITNGVTILGEHVASSAIFTANTPYFASNTAGGWATSAGTKEVSLGFAYTTTKIYFSPRYNQQITEDEQDALAGNNGTPSASNLYMTQLGIQRSQEIYGASSAGSDTYAITLSPVPAGYVAGMLLNFKTDVANTGACTLNVNSLGAITIKKLNDQDLETGDIEAGQVVTVVYDGTNFQMQSQIAQVPKASALQDTFTAGTYSPDISAGDAVFLYTDGFIYPFSSALSTNFSQESHFIGFANEAITAGNSGKINLWGVDANQSSLTVASIYRLLEASTSVETSYTSTVDAQTNCNGSEIWQSFTVGGADVDLVSVTIYFNGGSAGGAGTTVKIYTGEGTGGTLLATGTKASTGTTPTTATIALNIPITLSASTQYTVSVQTDADAQWDRKATTNPYAGGRASTDANSDFKFAVNKASSGLGGITTSGALAIVGIAKSATEVVIRHDDSIDP